jgi:hypothetical protein
MIMEKKLLPSGGKNRYYYDWILVSTIKEGVIA